MISCPFRIQSWKIRKSKRVLDPGIDSGFCEIYLIQKLIGQTIPQRDVSDPYKACIKISHRGGIVVTSHPWLGVFITWIIRSPIVNISRIQVISSSQIDHSSQRSTPSFAKDGYTLGGKDEKVQIKIFIVDPVIDTTRPAGHIRA